MSKIVIEKRDDYQLTLQLFPLIRESQASRKLAVEIELTEANSAFTPIHRQIQATIWQSKSANQRNSELSLNDSKLPPNWANCNSGLPIYSEQFTILLNQRNSAPH